MARSADRDADQYSSAKCAKRADTLMDDLPPPPGYVEGSASLPPPPGYVEGPATKQPQGWGAVAANAATGLLKGISNFGALPNTLASGYQALARGLGQPSPLADALIPNTPSAADTSRMMFGGINAASTAATGAPTSLPYTPETGPGQIGQSALSNVVPSLLSGGSAGMVPRIISGMAGGAGAQTAANASPDSYWAPLVGSIAGAAGGGLAAQGLGAVGSQIGNVLRPNAAAKQTVGRELAAAPPVPAWSGGPLVPGTPVPGSSGGGLSDLVTGLAGPVLGFAGEHLLEGAGGLGGAYIGKAATDVLHNFASSRSANALADIRQRVANDPAFAIQLAQQFSSSPGWRAYLAQRIPWAALPLPGGPSGAPLQ
jgi:hypothetical protein